MNKFHWTDSEFDRTYFFFFYTFNIVISQTSKNDKIGITIFDNALVGLTLQIFPAKDAEIVFFSGKPQNHKYTTVRPNFPNREFVDVQLSSSRSPMLQRDI